MPLFRTILQAALAEQVINHSRFIGRARPVNSEAQAKEFIEKINKQEREATHNVPVYLIGSDYGVQRYSDDGEPSGTAGLPVLEMLKKESISNLCLVITRYYGGVKLGAGGLVRAYTGVAKAALAGRLISVYNYQRLSLTYNYTFHGKLTHLLGLHQAHIAAATYSDCVSLTVYVKEAAAEKLIHELINQTADEISIQRQSVQGALLSEEFIELDRIYNP